MRFEICIATDVGCLREKNEDGFFINNMCCYDTTECFIYQKTNTPLLTFVADGVGGSRMGEEATRICTETAKSSHVPCDDNGLIELIDSMNQKVCNTRNKVDTACTLAGILASEKGLYCFNVGDSRVYSLAQGFLYQLSTDDTVSGLSGIISDTKEPLMQYIGKQGILPHIQEIKSVSTFLICTDGLTDLVSLDDIEILFEEHTNVKDLATMLVNRAKENGGHDNITLIIIKPIKEKSSNG